MPAKKGQPRGKMAAAAKAAAMKKRVAPRTKKNGDLGKEAVKQRHLDIEAIAPNVINTIEQVARLGGTNAEIAAALGIGEHQLQKRRALYPEISAALDRGRAFADDRVEQALYQRAIGYTQKVEKVAMNPRFDIEMRATVLEHVPADVSAGIFWLSNRRHEKWRRNPGANTGNNEDGNNGDGAVALFDALIAAARGAR